jgi:hypothetical protein
VGQVRQLSGLAEALQLLHPLLVRLTSSHSQCNVLQAELGSYTAHHHLTSKERLCLLFQQYVGLLDHKVDLVVVLLVQAPQAEQLQHLVVTASILFYVLKLILTLLPIPQEQLNI